AVFDSTFVSSTIAAELMPRSIPQNASGFNPIHKEPCFATSSKKHTVHAGILHGTFHQKR
ncbi:MAG: hypothetical protein J5672_07600, partial [Verrucomicrobia bacterium]|nr:hypothetical protein [Verrucomicrobiota bacterium]